MSDPNKPTIENHRQRDVLVEMIDVIERFQNLWKSRDAKTAIYLLSPQAIATGEAIVAYLSQYGPDGLILVSACMRVVLDKAIVDLEKTNSSVRETTKNNENS